MTVVNFGIIFIKDKLDNLLQTEMIHIYLVIKNLSHAVENSLQT